MPYKLRTFRCHNCGKTIELYAAEGSEQHCLECTVQRMMDNMAQMRYKRGPNYVKWANSMSAAAAAAQEAIRD